MIANDRRITWHLHSLWATTDFPVSAVRGVFTNNVKPSLFLVVKTYKDMDGHEVYSIKFWYDTSIDVVASQWNMTRQLKMDPKPIQRFVDLSREAINQLTIDLTYQLGAGK